MLEKSFDPAAAEPPLYEAWERSGAFRPSTRDGAAPFTIVIPPPNVTGSLHMGHALNNTLQDILCRFERMRGKAVLWQPGTDHAGIATQMVVERQLAASGNEDRRSLGRDEFVRRVWAWKEESGGQIINQLKRLGASCDWSRERFTMDEGLSAAVLKVFVRLFDEGLIYRDKRLVNWDPHFETAISDLEVENREVDGKFWHFKYPLENGETYEYVEKDADGVVTFREIRDYIAIATTRPETMLGDGAVAVHPDDARYAPIVGKRCLLPLADRYIPIITDEYPDPDFGSGAVKITGAHDFNDYGVAARNGIAMYDLFDSKARLVDADYVPARYRGLDRYDARDAIVADIDARGLLLRIEDKKIMQPFGDRSGVVIEPMRTDQWYVNAGELATRAVDAVETGKTRFVPDNWAKTYFQWMRNIEPWCISRQLWWGHRIPVWYGPQDASPGDDPSATLTRPFAAESAEEAARIAGKFYAGRRIVMINEPAEAAVLSNMEGGSEDGRPPVFLLRDPDVLDTWFSSALWPFSTLGWPEATPELKAHFPTSVLITAHDIIFFWVARMMMMGLKFMDDVPFRDVYIHALVLDEKGQKMSKSKGNVIDPLLLIEKYGADALRFSLAAQAAQGRNIRLSEARVEGYRNFTTKLWNAARFCEMNGCESDPSFAAGDVALAINRWIVHEANMAAREISDALEGYRFNDAAAAIYRFTWNVLCDWYLELAKPILQGEDGPGKDETRKTAAWALDRVLMMLHPFMPFVTEALWGERSARDRLLIVAPWPDYNESLANPAAAADVNWTIGLITAVRSTRAEMNVPPAAQVPLIAIAPDAGAAARLEASDALVRRLARLSDIAVAAAPPKGAVQIVHEGVVYALPLAGVIDLQAEKTRLGKEREKAKGEIGKIDAKLANQGFLAKAPAEVVDEQKARREEFSEQLAKLDAALLRLDAL